VANEADKAALAGYLEAICKAQSIDRREVCAPAAAEFRTERVLDLVLIVLNAAWVL
jgi:hypothetical protein